MIEALHKKEAILVQIQAVSTPKQLSDIIRQITETAELQQRLREAEIQMQQSIFEREAVVQVVEETANEVEMYPHSNLGKVLSEKEELCLCIRHNILVNPHGFFHFFNEPPKVTTYPKGVRNAVPKEPKHFLHQSVLVLLRMITVYGSIHLVKNSFLGSVKYHYELVSNTSLYKVYQLHFLLVFTCSSAPEYHHFPTRNKGCCSW